MNTIAYILPIEQLPAEIERLLSLAPRVVRELSRLTGYSEASIRLRLEVLESDKRAHSLGKGTLNRGNGYLEWRAGPAPAGTQRFTTSPKGVVPQQRITDIYPPCDRRDPLVEALFGPVRSSICVPDASGMPSPSVDPTPTDSVDVEGRHFDPLTSSRSKA